MKIAVTGGSGQLGTLVLKRLIADPSIKEIVCFDKRPPAVLSDKLRTVLGDIRDAGLEEHFAGCDAVVHLAFLVTVRAPRDVFWGVNVDGSKNVFLSAAKAGAKHVIYSSSVAAYGVVPGHPNPIVEDTPRRHQPDFPYSATKFEVEAFLDEFEKEHAGIAVTRIRPSILVGEHMEHPLGAALKSRRLPASSDAPMPIVWDEDVADAILLVLKKRAAGAFNVCADDLLPPVELARAVGLTPLRIPVNVALAFARLSPLLERAKLGHAVDEAWIKSGGVSMVQSSERAKNVLGWKPQCPTAVSVMQKYLETVPRRMDRRLAIFFHLVGRGAKRAEVPDAMRGVSAHVHLHLTGAGGGEIGLVVDDGRLSVSRRAPRPPTAILTMPAKTMLDLLGGKTDFATALGDGSVHLDGDPVAGFMVGGIVEMFRAGKTKKGAEGAVTRVMGKWFAREGVA